ncbi:multi-sensor signal transduction histidine kinase [Tolypothrix tenuis PCC 7101]|uniref:histidine kinase n=1 Tax=Tolypothrix tenuis PCC 7101 TaxID=231146 RepID=A0A1Z4N0H0_9CYAN|nr:response regulator [Aulosira sp. FACHB-113]BAY99190.1 multi-sensor signal transduction histidine kinase [Tolypothrix tenuis PCC 7101]BAZ76887.1 multi-sensor signal transduction histidine kinase [Aulosira laxa NIES-50]
MLDKSTLLIIDDCAADRKIYRRYLLQDPYQSYQILEADCAESGLALCQEFGCDVILLDFCLPDMSGLDFFDKLNQKIFEAPIPVIMLTGRGDEEVAVQAMKRGAQDYIVKQYLKPEVLQLAVRNAIKQSYLQAQLYKHRERQRLIATTALRIRQSLDLEQILNTAVVEVQQLLKCDRVMVYQFTSDIEGKTVACSIECCESAPAYNNIQNVCNQVGGERQHWGCKLPMSDFYNAGWSNFYLQLLEQFKNEENLVAPINLSNNDQQEDQLWGLLIAHHSSGERGWQTDEVEMLNELSVQLAIAIQQAELLAQTQAALAKEKQLNAFKSQIVATVSHEYRTPLTSILAAASTVIKHGQHLDDPKKQKLLGIIEHKARSMAKLVDNMLMVNQIELDKTRFQPIPLNLLQFFSDLMEQEQELISDRHELIFHSSGNYQDFWGDRGLLQQIFVNLMSNAVKYSPQGGTVEVRLLGKESEVMFAITDQGIGIPIADQEHLFQSFGRGSNVGTIPGTGLGLAIAKSCVELHGGKITLSSQVDQGTTVTVTLPKQPKVFCAKHF